MDITVVLGIIFGGSFLAFLQFLIARHDSKKEKKDEILQEVKCVRKDVADLKIDTEARFDKMDRKIDDTAAVQSRVRVLRFFDEAQNGVIFSKDAWAQALEDVSDYETHCEKYENFPNSKAEPAMKNLKVIYDDLLAKERNGENVFL